MSMTKTGIIGLVVLIVILIGGYSIVTQTEDGGPLGENATTTNETENGTTTDEAGEDEDAVEETNGGETGQAGNAEEDTSSDTTGADTETENGNGGTETQSTEFGGGIGGSGDAGVVQEGAQSTSVTKVEVANYSNAELGVAFEYPKTWDIDEDDETVVAGKSFAGGMKSEMSVTVHEDVNIEEVMDRELSNVREGAQYEGEFMCKGEDLDCAGRTVFVPVEGEETEDGWEGKVVEVSFGVYEMSDYEGPDVGVSPDELLEVAGSTFSGAANSFQIASS